MMAKRSWKILLATTLCAMGALVLDAAAADPYPAKPIKIVVPYTPGGGADILTRTLAAALTPKLGQQVIVENRPGGNTIIGSEYVANAQPDGYTLLLVPASFAINPSFYKVPYDTVKGFAPVGLVALVPLMLVANPNVQINSVKDLIDLAKAKPGKLTFASYGSGSPAHLAGELFKSMVGVDMLHIPYKGSAPALADVVAGHVAIMFSSMSPAVPLVKSGRLKGIAVSTAKRVPAMKDLPTIAEAGVPGYEVQAWNGIVAPAGTPKEIVAKLNRAIVEIVATKEFSDRISAQGFEPESSSPEEFAELIQRDILKWAKVIKDSGAKPD
ncbi:MAG: tripartite tricarboxylate transporter substrate binding protein [Betaproteobacteria bacterium]|nr:tripartite tricarboxylate transporter substrate binding protein [Betaproteobacteria bacterium]